MIYAVAALVSAIFVGVAYLANRRHAWWVNSVDTCHPRVLMYHMICEIQPDHQFRGLRVSPTMFEQQLRWLTEQGWRFVTMSELKDSYDKLPEKTVALTFDDGFLDNYTVAFPLLKKYNAKATLYLVVDRHENDWQTRKKAHHDSGEVTREPKLTDAQVREMIESGIFELGGHTIDHVNLAQEDTETKRKQIADGRRILQETFGVPVESFAYPFGIFSDEDVEIVRQAGFTTAVTVEEGIDTEPDFLRLRRIKVSGKDTFLTFTTRMRIGWRGYRI